MIYTFLGKCTYNVELLIKGSTTIFVVPLTSIKHQILNDCDKIGISVLDGDQVVTFCFTILARLIARALFSGPASRLGEGAGEAPYTAACLARILRVN